MDNINITKIIKSISITPEFIFNSGDSIIKMDTNSYLVNSPTYCQNESGTDVYTYEELLFFIKKHSTIFEDKFDNSAYKKQNYQKPIKADLSIDNYFSKKESLDQEPQTLSKYDLYLLEIEKKANKIFDRLGL